MMMLSFCRNGLLLMSVLLLLNGCLSPGFNPQPGVAEGSVPGSRNGFLAVTVGPGDGGSCRSAPCRIFYRMPDLGREAEVVVNSFTVGTFPSGKVVDLGSFSDTSVRISIPGSDVPIAYVSLPGESF
jgi:hypothetical protein